MKGDNLSIQNEQLVIPLPKVLANDDGIRPAGNTDECFYCRQKVGQPHKFDCVALHRMVKVRYTYEIEIEVPHFWDKEAIEFHRNESSWCADNGIGNIEEYLEKNQICSCGCFKAEVIEVPDKPPYAKVKLGEVAV